VHQAQQRPPLLLRQPRLAAKRQRHVGHARRRIAGAVRGRRVAQQTAVRHLREQVEHQADRVAAADRRPRLVEHLPERLEVAREDRVDDAHVEASHVREDVFSERLIPESGSLMREVARDDEQRARVEQRPDRRGEGGVALSLRLADDERHQPELAEGDLEEGQLDLQGVLAPVCRGHGREALDRAELPTGVPVERDAPERRLVVRDVRHGDAVEPRRVRGREDHDAPVARAADRCVGVPRRRTRPDVAGVRGDERPDRAELLRGALRGVEVALDLSPQLGRIRRIPRPRENGAADDGLLRRLGAGRSGTEEEEREEAEGGERLHGVPGVVSTSSILAGPGRHLNRERADPRRVAVREVGRGLRVTGSATARSRPGTPRPPAP
jgi:hypothetical protein